MKQLSIVTRGTIDGVEAAVPSIRECETWGPTEDEALSRLLERVAFFLHLPNGFRHTLDRSRKEEGETHYVLIIRDGQ